VIPNRPQDDSALLVDARGHRCPTPTLRLRRALDGVQPGALVRLLADDPMARIDVPHFVQSAGHQLVQAQETAKGLSFTVRKSSSA
jgi:tRNA 2-thiouridine synthesizing protein A